MRPCCKRTPCVDRDVLRARTLPNPDTLPRMPDSVVNYEDDGGAAPPYGSLQPDR